jgi:hypothetical protein
MAVCADVVMGLRASVAAPVHLNPVDARSCAASQRTPSPVPQPRSFDCPTASTHSKLPPNSAMVSTFGSSDALAGA